jgi:hypothetical protein
MVASRPARVLRHLRDVEEAMSGLDLAQERAKFGAWWEVGDHNGSAWEVWQARAALDQSPVSAANTRLLNASKVYAFNYCQDEAEDEEDCVCGPKQHAEAVELFAAIAAANKGATP